MNATLRCAAGLLLSMGLLHCREGGLTGTLGELSYTPKRVDFGNAWLGHDAAATVDFRNLGRKTISVALEVPTQLTADALSFALEAGELRTVSLSLRPEALGAYAGTVNVSSEGLSAAIDLVANVQSPLECPPSGPCNVSVFDPLTGSCSSAPAADGSSCADLDNCISSGSCFSGTCISPTPQCDDGNACTADACAKGQGCVHEDRTSECAKAADENPCVSAFCDPVKGCQTTPVDDGTACGDNDCITSHICLNGSCVDKPSVEGSACGSFSPCQPLGLCEGTTCIRSEKTQLVPHPVELGAPGTVQLNSAGSLFAADALGRIYVAALTYNGLTDGVAVGRISPHTYLYTPLHPSLFGKPVRLQGLAIRGNHLFASSWDGTVSALNVDTAQLSWTADVAALVNADKNAPDFTGGFKTVFDHLTLDTLGRVHLLAKRAVGFEMDVFGADAWVSLDAKTGALLSIRYASGEQFGSAVSASNAYLNLIANAESKLAVARLENQFFWGGADGKNWVSTYSSTFGSPAQWALERQATPVAFYKDALALSDGTAVFGGIEDPSHSMLTTSPFFSTNIQSNQEVRSLAMYDPCPMCAVPVSGAHLALLRRNALGKLNPTPLKTPLGDEEAMVSAALHGTARNGSLALHSVQTLFAMPANEMAPWGNEQFRHWASGIDSGGQLQYQCEIMLPPRHRRLETQLTPSGLWFMASDPAECYDSEPACLAGDETVSFAPVLYHLPLPGVNPATAGWVSPTGNAQRNFSALP